MTLLAEERTEATSGTALVRIGGVALTVRDLDAVTGFYRDTVGLAVLERRPDTVRLGAGGTLFLELRHRPDALLDAPATAGLFHTAFLLPGRADLARWLRHAAQNRVPLDGASDHLVSEAIYLSDPEGNGVEIYADRPRAVWRWTDGQVAMTTQRLDLHALLGAAEGPDWSGAPAGARIGHVHLRVGEVAEAVRFYTGTLGMEVVAARPGAAFMSTGRYHHHIAVNTWQSRGAGPRDPNRAGLAEVILEAEATALPPRAGTCTDPWGTALTVRRV